MRVVHLTSFVVTEKCVWGAGGGRNFAQGTMVLNQSRHITCILSKITVNIAIQLKKKKLSENVQYSPYRGAYCPDFKFGDLPHRQCVLK